MNGIINVYKEKGISSFGVVSEIRKICKIKKVGHTGTLDPEATGVLPICIGKSTKLVDYITNGNKEYIAKMKLGITTDTYDMEGNILSENKNIPSKEIIENVILSFKGESLQEPPMYSAIKKNGKRLYELAREGIVIEREKRPINVYEIEILSIEKDLIEFRILVSKGTYIRSICNDIGIKLNCGGVMVDLKRTKTSNFFIRDSIKLCDINENNISSLIIAPEEYFRDLEKIIIKEEFLKLILNGVKVSNEEYIKNIKPNCKYRIFNDSGSFLGIGKLENKAFDLYLRLY